MKVTLGFSPCPNDTFIFDALVNNKIETDGISFEVILEDVETLNELALKNTLDISKISYGVLPLLLDNYMVLNCGSALGTGVGPLLVSKKTVQQNEINNYQILIPGENTTAHMLFSRAYPEANNKLFVRYNEIEETLLSSDDDIAGVIIHENRFTYEKKGLKKIMDLGEYWENTTKLPIPLGGIVAKRTIDDGMLKKIDALIKESIEFAFSNYPEVTDYVKEHSQEMEEDVMRKHIDLYVNNYSIDLGDEGKNAVKDFLKIYQNTNHAYGFSNKDIFLK